MRGVRANFPAMLTHKFMQLVNWEVWGKQLVVRGNWIRVSHPLIPNYWLLTTKEKGGKNESKTNQLYA